MLLSSSDMEINESFLSVPPSVSLAYSYLSVLVRSFPSISIFIISPHQFFCGLQLSAVLPVLLLQGAFFLDGHADLLYLYFQPKNFPLLNRVQSVNVYFSSSFSFITIELCLC